MSGGNAKFEVGQQVWVYDRYGRGGPKAATVSKVGRTLVTVGVGHQAMQYRMETGYVNDGFGHSWIKTAKQRTDDERQRDLVAELKSAGIELRLGHRMPLELMEDIAAVVRRHATGSDQEAAE